MRPLYGPAHPLRATAVHPYRLHGSSGRAYTAHRPTEQHRPFAIAVARSALVVSTLQRGNAIEGLLAHVRAADNAMQ